MQLQHTRKTHKNGPSGQNLKKKKKKQSEGGGFLLIRYSNYSAMLLKIHSYRLFFRWFCSLGMYLNPM